MLWKSALLAILLGIAWWPLGVLVGLYGLIILFKLLSETRKFMRRRREYKSGLGAVMDDQGVTFFSDLGPREYTWSDFGEVYVWSRDGSWVLLHLPVNAQRLTGYAHAEARHSTPIDYLDIAPEEMLQTLASHPGFRGEVLGQRAASTQV